MNFEGVHNTVKSGVRGAIYRATLEALRHLGSPAELRRFKLTILKLDRLGDGVLSLGAVRLLTRRYGESETLLIVSPIAEALFRQEFPNAEILVMPAFCARFFPDFVMTMTRHVRILRAIETDLLVCLRHQPSDYLHAISLMMQVKQCHAACWDLSWERTSLAYPSCQTTPYPETVLDGICLELEAHRRVLEGVLGTPVAADEIRPAFSFVQSRPETHLLVCPMAGDPLRQYPPSLMARAVRLFLNHQPEVSVGLCLPPGVDHAPWANAFHEEEVAVAQWICPRNVPQLVEIILGASVLLCPDSAPAHIATALDKPSVFMLGGGHHGIFAPWRRSDRQRWLSHAMPCYQCRWNCHQVEPFCITHIPPQDVAGALAEVFSIRQELPPAP